ncbi:MAG: ABC1 kinase family protein, partial [Anaerolineae bacterium]
VVKVQRPGVERQIQADLLLLQTQARFLERRSSFLSDYGLLEVVREFSASLESELDYALEGRNADRLRELDKDGAVLLPAIIWDHTSHRVLTMTDLQGIRISDRDALAAAGYDLKQVAEHIIDAYMSQVFVHGIFHADPHPGNIMVCGDRIGLVDFGNVGYLTPSMRGHLGTLLFALVRQDADEMLQVLGEMGAVAPHTDTDAVRRELQRLLLRYYGISLESIPISRFLSELMSLAFRYQMRLPADLALLARTVIVLEGVVRSLDPGVVLAKRLEPFIIRLLRERVSPKRLGLDAVKALDDLRAVLQVLPRRVDLLTDQLSRGDLTVGVDLRRMDQMLRRAEAIGNRISFSVVLAALIMGSALILLGGEDAAAFRLPFTEIVVPVPQIGFLVAGLLGAWWLISVVRSRGI